MRSLDKYDVLSLAAGEDSAAHDRLRDIYRQLRQLERRPGEFGAYAAVRLDGMVCSIGSGWAGQCRTSDVIGEIESWADDYGVALNG